MKKIFLFAAAAFMVACSSDDLTVDEPKPAQLEEGAVGFDAYMQRTTTRAGLSSVDLKIEQLKQGFGVFGYYTDNKDYDQTALPNFFYNEEVKWTTYWEYSPVKYWPNEYGYNAISDDADKVSFFAYAPFVNVEPGTGKVKPTAADKTDMDTKKTAWESDPTDETKKADYYAALAKISSETGITSMTRNSNAGDPIIKYVASFDNSKAVDLCWGVCQQNDWQLVETGRAQEFTLGKPWLNVQRPGDVDQKLKFMFRHATAKMQIMIDEYNDAYKATDDEGDIKKAETRIWVRSVRLSGFTMQGALNLNNETANEPYWMNYSGLGDLSVTEDVIVYDQRKDGKEGVAGAVATNEKVGGLNEQLIQKEGLVTTNKWIDDRLGVRKTAVSLFQTASDNKWFYVIPSGDDMEIEIVYDVETINTNLYTNLSDGETKGSSIENRITKKIKFGDNITKLEAGKFYVVKLHIGMNDVDFDADIVDWDNMPTPDIDLPANMPAYAVTETTATLEIPGAATSFDFAVTNLKGGESVTAVNKDAAGNPFVSADVTIGSKYGLNNKAANASGVAYLNVSGVAKNTTIVDVTTEDAVVVTPAITTTGAFNLKVIQKAEALKLKAPTSPVAGSVFALERTGIGTWDADNTNCPVLAAYPGTSNNNYIRVWRNGAELPITTGFTFNNVSGEITLIPAAESGETIKVTIKASTVAEETITFSIP